MQMSDKENTTNLTTSTVIISDINWRHLDNACRLWAILSQYERDLDWYEELREKINGS